MIFRIVFLFGLFFVFCLYIVFRDRLTPHISEDIVFVNTLLYWALLITSYHVHPVLMTVAMIISLPPSIAALINALIDRRISPALKLRFYVWNLWLIFFILLYGFISLDMWALLIENDMSSVALYDLLVLGLFCALFVFSLNPFFRLIPVDKDSIREVKKHAAFLSSRYSDTQMQGSIFVSVSVFIALVFFVNYAFVLVEPITLVSLLIVLSPGMISNTQRFIDIYVLKK